MNYVAIMILDNYLLFVVFDVAIDNGTLLTLSIASSSSMVDGLDYNKSGCHS